MPSEPISIDGESVGLRLDRWFLRRYPSLSKARLEQLLRGGQIRVNKGRTRSHYRLQAEDLIRIPPFLSDEPPPPQKDKLTDSLKARWQKLLPQLVLYEDDDIIAINKPSGLAVQGGSKIGVHLDKLLPLLVPQDAPRPRLVHRLDKDTSGVLLLAKNRQAASQLTQAFKEQQISKLYWAITAGTPPKNKGKISAHIEKQTQNQFERMQTVTPSPKPSPENSSDEIPTTLYQQVETSPQNNIAWLKCAPLSGKTHQIRVHLASIKTPILGDKKYGGKIAIATPTLPKQTSQQNSIKQIYLHARAIKYNNKIIKAEPNDNFLKMLNNCKLNPNNPSKDKFLP